MNDGTKCQSKKLFGENFKVAANGKMGKKRRKKEEALRSFPRVARIGAVVVERRRRAAGAQRLRPACDAQRTLLLPTLSRLTRRWYRSGAAPGENFKVAANGKMGKKRKRKKGEALRIFPRVPRLGAVVVERRRRAAGA